MDMFTFDVSYSAGDESDPAKCHLKILPIGFIVCESCECGFLPDRMCHWRRDNGSECRYLCACVIRTHRDCVKFCLSIHFADGLRRAVECSANYLLLLACMHACIICCSDYLRFAIFDVNSKFWSGCGRWRLIFFTGTILVAKNQHKIYFREYF